MDWKIFESPIYEAFKNEDKDLSKGGRPPFDRLILFKALVIQSLYNLSDVKADTKTKLIEEFIVTDASVCPDVKEAHLYVSDN